MAAAGASAGVSVAFGAPIGGTLFSYEMSRPNTFWRFSMIWKVFLACSLGTFFLALLNNLYANNLNGSWSGSTLKFGTAQASADVNMLYLLPASIVLGIVGGLLGALFISVNTKMNAYRKRFLTTKWIKPIETFFWCFATASFFFFTPLMYKQCKVFTPLTPDDDKIKETLHEGWCDQKETDPD